MREPLSGETTNQSFQSRFALHTLENVEKRAGTITGWHKTPFGSGIRCFPHSTKAEKTVVSIVCGQLMSARPH
jgi:hypothetical protein